MGGKSKRVTVGYRYHLGMHMVFCHGPVDFLKEIRVDDRIAWQGEQDDGLLSINRQDLFGGDEREGGIQGELKFAKGANDQQPDSYLISQLGASIPAFRGVASFILRRFYLGMNPYLKPWAARMQRIHVRQDGVAQWYDEKAEISAEQIEVESTGWEYQILEEEANPGTTNLTPPADGWISGAQAPFGGGAPGGGSWPIYDIPPNTEWPVQTVLWARKTITRPTLPLVLEVFAENGCVVFVNGTQVGTINPSNSQPPTENLLKSFDIPQQSTPSLTITIKAFDEDGGETGATYLFARLLANADMNPAHIIRESITDPDWGMGYPEADIDDTSYTAAADTLFDERMGMSLLWDRQVSLEDFVNDVARHIDAAHYLDRRTGRFTLKLIRDDYDIGELVTLGPSNIDRIEGYARPSPGETVNTVVVNYWDAITRNTESVTVDDTALVRRDGRITETISYPGFTNAALATRVAARDLRALSAPLLSCTIYTNSAAEDLAPGDPFLFDWPDLHADPVVMRVTEIAFGNGRSNAIRIRCTEDVFSIDDDEAIGEAPSEWNDPVGDPQVATHRVVVEAPYYELVQQEGQSAVDDRLTENANVGFLLASAAAPTGDSIKTIMYVDDGAGFEERVGVDFCPFTFLDADIGPTDTVWPVTGGEGLDLVVLGTHCQIGDELCVVNAISANGDEITVGRAVLDTVPENDGYTAGAAILFWDDYADGDPTEYEASESVDVKLLTVAGQGTLAEGDAPSDTVAFNQRAYRPYPPGNVKINNQYFPDEISDESLVVTFSHRDRTQQTSGVLHDFTEGDIGPEPGTTYNGYVYDDERDLLLLSEDGISSGWSPSIAGTYRLRIELESERDAVSSYFRQVIIFDYFGPNTRATEGGEFRVTEDSEYRVSES